MKVECMFSGALFWFALAAAHAGEPARFACRLGALDAGQRARRSELARRLRSVLVARRELADGYGFELRADPETFLAAAEWVALERLCCPFLSFGLEWREGEVFLLRLTGPPGVKEFVDAAFRPRR